MLFFYRCALIDDNAYILYHPKSMDQPSTSLTLSNVAADTADYLLFNNYMTSQRCDDFAWKKKYLTYHVTLQEAIDSLDRDPWLYIAPINDTNVFLLVRQKTRGSDQDGVCLRSCLQQNPFQTRCQADAMASCSCPCYENIPYNYCENKFLQQNDDAASPCSVSLVDTKQILRVNTTSTSMSIRPCFNYTCDVMTDAWRCELTGNCEWNENNHCTIRREATQASTSKSGKS